jgi:hypothetical protein
MKNIMTQDVLTQISSNEPPVRPPSPPTSPTIQPQIDLPDGPLTPPPASTEPIPGMKPSEE